MVGLALAVVFGLSFRDEIARSMSRLAVKVGGVEISAQAEQAPPAPEAASLPAPTESATGTAVEAVAPSAAEPAAAPASTAVVDAHGAPAHAELAAELARVQNVSSWRLRMWWFWWLQSAIRSLVPRTINVLRWLSGQANGTASYEAYEQRWKPEIAADQATGELSAMFDVLVRLDMITAPSSRATLAITDTGRKFLDYLDGKWNPMTDPTIV
jgi:hypothetical protein